MLSFSGTAVDIRLCISASFQAGTPGNCMASARTTSSESDVWLPSVLALYREPVPVVVVALGIIIIAVALEGERAEVGPPGPSAS